ncbi:MAG: DUF1850 domain-containing protein [Bifidobacteriaceae bacterium]|nr:DUF1850 domain-containing protein [Bifidobacteriaceae bacterium]
MGLALSAFAAQPVLRIERVDDAVVLVSVPVQVGDQFVFGWEHSLEKIPWDEFYHVDSDLDLVLDTIRFPAFGAGIPEAKGTDTWIEGGAIHMGGIDEPYAELVWINSSTATKDLTLDGAVIARGQDLPPGARLRLSIAPRWGQF